ncbi:MAG: ferritin family protein [Desulfuromusa sp.]|jgi:rubrerythrin|nr:ferritin family protein [Desulfuromusa sp.]
MNVFDYALKMELDGKAFYEKLAKETESEGLRKIFNELAEDEQKHYDIFSQLKENKNIKSMPDSVALEGAKNVFTEMQKDVSSQKLLKTNLDAYQQAMNAEKESAKLYRDAAAKEENTEVKALLLKISIEEEKHLNILENIFDFVNAPTQLLVWGEFSNLKEY